MSYASFVNPCFDDINSFFQHMNNFNTTSLTIHYNVQTTMYVTFSCSKNSSFHYLHRSPILPPGGIALGSNTTGPGVSPRSKITILTANKQQEPPG